MKTSLNSFFLILVVLVTNLQSQYQKINSNGVDVHFRIFGKGEPILVIGGGPGDASDRYLSLCEGLAKTQQCILVDQRGTGKSIPAVQDSTTLTIALTLSDFEAIRQHLGLKQWHVLGFSYGGYLASLYTSFYPGSISALILLGSMGLNTDMFSYFLDNITSRLQPCDLELFNYWNDSARIAENPKHALVERIRARMPGYFYDRKKSLNVSQIIKDEDFNFDMGQWIWNDIGRKQLDLSVKPSNYNRPVLILHGRQDPVGETVAFKLSNYYKNSTLIFIEKCGHYSWVEQPEKVFASINTFLSKK